MIWDFKGRRPLPTRDYVVSIKDGLATPYVANLDRKNWVLAQTFHQLSFVKHGVPNF